MNTIAAIQSCEEAYVGCFSTKSEDGPIIRYEDLALTDMYDHNYSSIRSHTPEQDMREMIVDELNRRKEAGYNFCKIDSIAMFPEYVLDMPFGKMEKTHLGYYVYVPMISPAWRMVDTCTIRLLNDDSMVTDLIAIDLLLDEGVNGEDFCIRKMSRKSRVYLSEAPLNTYICYQDSMPVGKCDLLIKDGIAKIEDFAIIPQQQKRGIGTTVLKYVIEQALLSGAKLIYLAADEEDTPKQMYMNMGFEKVTDRYSYRWNW